VGVGSGQDAAQRNAVTVRHSGALQALFAAVDRGPPGDLAAAGGFGDRAVDGDLVDDEADDPVVEVQGDLLEPDATSGTPVTPVGRPGRHGGGA